MKGRVTLGWPDARSAAWMLVAALLCRAAFSEDASAIVARKTDLYGDYGQTLRIGTIGKNERVRILPKDRAHAEDGEYWGFDLLINKGSIMVEYGGRTGYIPFDRLQAADGEKSRLLHGFCDKVLVPEYYCDTLYHLDSGYIEKADPFALEYDRHIKYIFIDDVNEEWHYNYPVNFSYLNDVFFQFASIPNRYCFKAFILELSGDTLTCVVEDNFDQFGLYGELAKYECGSTYTFHYSLDGDYVSIRDGGKRIFHGAFVERETWESVNRFIKRRLMKDKREQASYDGNFSIDRLNALKWPAHADGRCDYPARRR